MLMNESVGNNIFNSYKDIEAKSKNDCINEIINRVSSYLNGQQLFELNKILDDVFNRYEVFIKNELGEEKDPKRTNENLLEIFIKTKLMEGLSERTIKYYGNVIERLMKNLDKSFPNIEAEDIRGYLFSRQDVCGKVSLENERRVFSSFFGWLNKEGYILKNPMSRVHKIKSPKRIKHPFSNEEIEILRDYLINRGDKQVLRDIAIFELLLSSGVRCAELCSLKRTDIDLTNNTFTVIGKGNKERECYFNDRTTLRLRNYLESRTDNQPCLFYSKFSSNNMGEGISTAAVGKMLRDMGKQCGIKEVHPHRFRHTFATNMLKHNMPLEQVQKLLGHSKMDTTLIYAEVSQEDVKHNHRKFSNG